MLTASLDVSQETQPGHQESTPVHDVDFQHLLAVAHEKQRQQLQEVRCVFSLVVVVVERVRPSDRPTASCASRSPARRTLEFNVETSHSRLFSHIDDR